MVLQDYFILYGGMILQSYFFTEGLSYKNTFLYGGYGKVFEVDVC